VRLVAFLKHFHTMFFAHGSYLIKSIRAEPLVAGAAELFARHCFHGFLFNFPSSFFSRLDSPPTME
jgi:hypothetical protein